MQLVNVLLVFSVTDTPIHVVNVGECLLNLVPTPCLQTLHSYTPLCVEAYAVHWHITWYQMAKTTQVSY